MNKLEIYKNDNYALNDAFDQAVMNIHIQKKQNGYKTFVICGCEAGDGATTVSINLAAAFAEAGWKTVLVDGDMRKKNRHKHLNEDVESGLSDYLMEEMPLDKVICKTTTENLDYIACGELIDNPVRLLCSSKMVEVRDKLEKEYDLVIYDMPAVNASMDARVMAVNVDAVILVSSVGSTSKKGLVEAANSLAESKVNLIGTIVNKLDMKQYSSYREEYDYFKKEKYIKKIDSKKKRK